MTDVMFALSNQQMKQSKQPENTNAIVCYYNPNSIVLHQRLQGKLDAPKEYLAIDRKTKLITVTRELGEEKYEEKRFSALLGIVKIEEESFVVFCEEARIMSTVDTLQIFEISSLFFFGFTEEKYLKRKPQRKSIYEKIRQYNILLRTGFYFSQRYNLTQPYRLQKTKILAERYTWNYQWLKELQSIKSDNWKCAIIQGFVKSFEVFLQGTKLSYILISRRSNKKGGTRYFDRGLNEEGFVANFVETEQIIKLDEFFVSDLQIRGSIPIFFQQVGLTTRTKVNRGYELTHEVYKKHINKLTKQYSRIFFANLLSVGKKGENMLIKQLQSHIKSEVNPALKYLYYDFHHKVKGGYYEKVDEIIEEIRNMKINLRYHIYDSKKDLVLDDPNGVFRTNCLDCLDRTNFFQAKVALITLEAILKQFNICNRNLLQEMKSNDEDNEFIKNFRHIWADNGDAISYHYTGTGSTHTDITRDGKRGWLGNFKHKYKTITRFYNQNYWDFHKMKLVDLLLGESRQKDKLTKMIKERENEFCKKEMHEVYIFSWKAPKKVPKSLVLFPNTPKILVINIQDLSQDEKWNKLITESVDNDRYILVEERRVHNNMLKIFAHKELKKDITFVEHGKIKFKSYYNAVLSNKCANFVRFSLNSTKLVFIGCQLEYGKQFLQNRIKNLRQIHENAFQIEQVGVQKSDHILQDDIIFLFGNMNTNISSSFKTQFQKFNPISQMTEQKKLLIEKMIDTDEFEEIRENLLEYREYEEEIIRFLPTYKYVNGGYEPDRSGWPDRIWYSTLRNKIDCVRYSTIEEMRQEHVPVIGTYSVEIERINQELKESICSQIIQKGNFSNLLDLGNEEQEEQEEQIPL